MIELTKYTTEGFSPGYRELLNKLAVREGGDKQYETPAPQVAEPLVRCLWFDGMFKSEGLVTEDGRSLRIISPGRWNVEPGPDFIGAQISLADGPTLTGDVEIHVCAEDWMAHAHDRNPAYDKVILNVALWNKKRLETVRNSKGKSVPVFTMAPFLEGSLSELADSVDVEDYPALAQRRQGLCRARLVRGTVSLDWLGRFLDLAGDERVIAKSRELRIRLSGSILDRVLYEAIMEALGYKTNKEPFKQLAQRLRLEDIRRLTPLDAPPDDRAIVVQGLMFGMAGLLPSQTSHDITTNDEETQLYATRLEAVWASERGKLAFKPMSLADWRFTGIRPVNYPTRRIAGMSYLISDHLENGLFRSIIERLERARWSDKSPVQRPVKPNIFDDFFAQANRGYWTHRYVFGGKRLLRPMALIGKERGRDIMVNVAVPLLLVHAREKKDVALERNLHQLYASLPRMEGNAVTRYMETTLFPSPEVATQVVCSVRRQQGLYQLFKDCCENPSVRCDDCVLVRAMQH